MRSPQALIRLRRLLRPSVTFPLLVIGVVLAAVAAYLFQPWKLWIDETVNQALPGIDAARSRERVAGGPGQQHAAAVRVVASGRFVSHEHETSGNVQVLRLTNGSRVLRLEDLATSNGPDLHVWVTDAPVLPGPDGWFVFDDGRYVDLGELKGNLGNQNYPLPRTVDLTELDSVSIWCDRFNVSFGAARLSPGS